MSDTAHCAEDERGPHEGVHDRERDALRQAHALAHRREWAVGACEAGHGGGTQGRGSEVAVYHSLRLRVVVQDSSGSVSQRRVVAARVDGGCASRLSVRGGARGAEQTMRNHTTGTSAARQPVGEKSACGEKYPISRCHFCLNCATSVHAVRHGE